MKKTLLTIAMVGILTGACSKEQESVFDKLPKEKSFRIGDYKENILYASEDKKDSVMTLFFDMDRDGIPDLAAMTKIIAKRGTKYRMEPYAFAVKTNRYEKSFYDWFYFDMDGDRKFDVMLRKKEKIPLSI